MAEKILYILGAGASAGILPLAKSVLDSFGEVKVPGLIHELENFVFDGTFDELNRLDKSGILNTCVQDFRNLAINAKAFGDIDTYAKYLNLKQPGGEAILNLKSKLAKYFMFKQFNGRLDERYLSWLVSIMNRQIFPENVKILSWNYDYQVEIAATRIGAAEDVQHSGNSFTHSPSMLLSYPNLDPTFSDWDQLALLHLNGVAGLSREGEFNLESFFQPRNVSNAQNTLNFVASKRLDNYIHFVWESTDYHQRLKERIDSMIAGCSIMVIIGYSFPFFNRNVDKEIFNSLKSSASLKKIYYQDPILNGQQLKAQFGLKRNFEIIHIKHTERFYIPFEY